MFTRARRVSRRVFVRIHEKNKMDLTNEQTKAMASAAAKREVAESSLDFLHYSIVDAFSRCTVLQGLRAAAAVAAAAYLCDW